VIAAAPEDVWAVLADPPTYGEWVVGSSEVLEWDPAWPAAGTRFQHRVGFKPFTISDHTEVIESDAPSHLELRAKARPFGVAKVTLDLQPHPDGTLVTMIEDPDGPWHFLFPPPLHLLMRARNAEALRRLEGLALSRKPASARSTRSRAAGSR
jgi:hypothetical protein